MNGKNPIKTFQTGIQASFHIEFLTIGTVSENSNCSIGKPWQNHHECVQNCCDIEKDELFSKDLSKHFE